MRVGGDPAVFERALGWAREASSVDPDAAGAWLLTAWIVLMRGQHAEINGRDPREHFRQAAVDAHRAAGLSPLDAMARYFVGMAHHLEGLYAANAGGDPEEAFERAEAEYTLALAIEERMDILQARARSQLQRAVHRQRTGGDADTGFEGAERDASRAMEIAPSFPETFQILGAILVNRTGWHQAKGGDFESSCGRARQMLQKYVEARPKDAVGWMRLCDALANHAIHVHQAKEDAGPHFEQAMAACERALAITPGSPEGLFRRAQTRTAWIAAGARNRAELDAGALRDFDEVVRQKPQDAEIPQRRGMLHQLAGRWREALTDYESAAALNPHLRGVLKARMDRCRRALGQ